MKYRVKEYVTPARKVRIDREKGIIYDVRVTGKKSKNKREYSDQALDNGLHLFENVSVYVDHKKGINPDKLRNRPIHEHGGVLKNCRRSSDGIRADIHYNRSTPAGKMILEAAERFSEHFGLSQVSVVDGVERDGIKLINRIVEVISVDVVKDPATTEGIFEAVSEPADGAMTVEAALLALQTAVLGDSTYDDAVKEKWIKELNKLKTKMAPGDGEGESEEADPAEETPVGESVEFATRLEAVETLLQKLVDNKESVKKPVPKVKAAPKKTVAESVETPVPPPKFKSQQEVLVAWGVED